MSRRRNLILLGAASVGLVALALVLVMNARDAAQPEASTAAAAQGSFGVRADAIDSARRGEGEDQDPAQPRPDAPPVPQAPQVPVIGDASPPRELRPSEPMVSPAIVPDAAALANSEAVVAAMPAAKKAVEGTIEARRKAMREACWKGAAGQSASLPVEATFAADGALLALSISDDRGAPGLGACVRAQPLPLSIEPPGVGLTVQVPLTLP